MDGFWYECFEEYPRVFEKVIKHFGNSRFIMIRNEETGERALNRSLVDKYELLDFFDKKEIIVFIRDGDVEKFHCIVNEGVEFSYPQGAYFYKTYDIGEFSKRSSALTEGLLSCFQILESRLKDEE